jgi:hypothetical protein
VGEGFLGGRANFLRLFLTLTLHFVRVRCADFDAILCLVAKNGEEKTPRGLIPLGTPECEKVVTLSLHSSFHKNKQIQRLRLQVKKTCKHESSTQNAKVKAFSTSDALQFK